MNSKELEKEIAKLQHQIDFLNLSLHEDSRSDHVELPLTEGGFGPQNNEPMDLATTYVMPLTTGVNYTFRFFFSGGLSRYLILYREETLTEYARRNDDAGQSDDLQVTREAVGENLRISAWFRFNQGVRWSQVPMLRVTQITPRSIQVDFKFSQSVIVNF